ncbi:MAG: glycerophosphodiester phosphodiesterase [Thermoproteota archaeon]
MLRIGHRGAKAYEPENTLRSFKKALKLGVNAVELDVRRTKDNALIVIHDEAVDKTTDGSGLVKELTLEDIKELSTDKGEKIPTLEEVLDFLDRKVKILIELKEKGLEERVLDMILDRGLEEDVIIVSFHEEALMKVRELNGKVETGLIYVRHKNPLEKAKELGVKYLLPLYHFTHTSDVEKAHGEGLKVIVWTINKQEEVPKYIEKGVEGIASEKPDILNEI